MLSDLPDEGPEPCLEPGSFPGQLCGKLFGHGPDHGDWLAVCAAPPGDDLPACSQQDPDLGDQRPAHPLQPWTTATTELHCAHCGEHVCLGDKMRHATGYGDLCEDCGETAEKETQGDRSFSDRCSQCGKPFSDWACGPTHALIASERADEDYTPAPPDPGPDPYGEPAITTVNLPGDRDA